MSQIKKDVGYVVPHTHWDREWRYPIWQSRMLLVDFMDRLLEILDNDPDYRSFVLDGQSVVVEDYLEVRPEKKDKVIEYVKQGRISIGPWYTLPDLYPVDGECLVRNLLKGIKYCDSLGGHLKVGYNSFGWGQTAQFPQIYLGFGIDAAIAAKYVSKSRAPQCEYVWEAPDGSRILCTRMGEHARANFFMNAHIPILYGFQYLSSKYRFDWNRTGTVFHQADASHAVQDHFLLKGNEYIHEEMICEAVQKAWEAMNDTILKNHRLLMDGSDSSTPQPMLTEIIRKANGISGGRELVHSTLEEYMAKLKQELPLNSLHTVKGELRDGPAFACSGNALATRSYIKRLNRKAQSMLIKTAEPLSVMVSLLGCEYRKSFIDIAWKNLLQSQAHDSINGVTQDKTAEDTVNRLSQALEISDVVAGQALGELTERIDTIFLEKMDAALVVINTSAFRRSEIVRVFVDFPQEFNVWDFEVTDSEGRLIDKQLLSRKEKVVPAHDLNTRPWPFYTDRYCFLLDTGGIPACGYRTFKLSSTKTFNRNGVFWADMRTSKGEDISGIPNTLENEHLKATIHADGTVSLLDKETAICYQNLNYFEDTGDCGDYWVYYPPCQNRTYYSKGCSAELWMEENGPLSATICARLAMRVPVRSERPESGISSESSRSMETVEIPITVRYTLKRGARKLEVLLQVENRAEDHRMRVMFDTGIHAEKSEAEGHFTVDRRPVKPVRDEKAEYYPEMQTLPLQRFVGLNNGSAGFALLSNSLFEYEAMDNEAGTLALTLFRSVRNIICTEFRSAGVFPEQRGGQSLGMQEFEYALYPHKRNLIADGVYTESERLEVPLRIVQTNRHNGSLPRDMSFMEVQPDNLVLSAWKLAEDRNSYILRFFNPSDESVNGTVRFFKPVIEAYLTNLNEERLDCLGLYDEGKLLEIIAGANKIVTIELVFDE